MTPATHNTWPEPRFKVFSSSGRYVGYGSPGLGCFDIFLPGGEDEGLCGSIRGQEFFFSSDELAGRLDGNQVLYDNGVVAGRIEGNSVFSGDGSVIGFVEGLATLEAAAGAVLLLILNRWHDSTDAPNPALA